MAKLSTVVGHALLKSSAQFLDLRGCIPNSIHSASVPNAHKARCRREARGRVALRAPSLAVAFRLAFEGDRLADAIP
jgi:hypothetical protein